MQDLSMPMIVRLYGKHYDIHPIYATPGDQGHSGVARDRVYLILTLKKKLVPITDLQQLYVNVSKFIQKYVCTKPSDYMVSSKIDLLQEARKTAVCRQIRLRPVFG